MMILTLRQWIENRLDGQPYASIEGTVNDMTGFANGAEFDSEEDVRAYFAVAEQVAMFGEDAIDDQAVLDAMADAVIENRWHCAF